MNNKEEKISEDCGIYVITNLLNDKRYVGQTISFYHRWNQHKSKNPEQQIGKDIQKYGRENFKFEIIEKCKIEELDEKEDYWIKKLNTIIPYGYNIKYGGINGSTYNYKAIAEDWKNGYYCKDLEEKYQCEDNVIHKALILNGISQDEIYKRGEKNNCISIVAFDIETNEPLKLFYSACEAQRFFNVNNNNFFIEAIKNNYNCYGYYWDYANENNLPEKELNTEEFLKFQKIKENNYIRTSEFKEKMSIKNRTVERPNREEFKKIIREKSFLQIGKIFGVSDNAIRKWCNYYNLPRHKREINNMTDEEWELI